MSFVDAVLASFNSLHLCIVAHPTMQEFLSADSRVAIYPPTVLDPAQSLDFEADMDGEVFEMARVEGLQAELHYLLHQLCILEKALGLEPNKC